MQENDIRTEVIRFISEMGPGPFTLLFLWSLFDWKPATIPQIEEMIRAQFTRPSIRTYIRKLEALGFISGSTAQGVWVPSQAGKKFFSPSSSRVLIESLTDSETTTTNREKIFSLDAGLQADDFLDRAAVLTHFGVNEPKRSELAAGGWSARAIFNIACNLVAECKNSSKLSWSPGLLVYRLSNSDPARGARLEVNPYRMIHDPYCICQLCQAEIYGMPDQHDPELDPFGDAFDAVKFLQVEWGRK